MTQDALKHFRALIDLYSEAIRATDVKSNIVIIFIASLIPPLVILRDRAMPTLPLPLVVSPLLFVIILLILSLYPRHPRIGGDTFLVSNNADKSDFKLFDSIDIELDHIRTRCAALSQILYWKTFFLRAGLAICVVSVIIIWIILTYTGFHV